MDRISYYKNMQWKHFKRVEEYHLWYVSPCQDHSEDLEVGGKHGNGPYFYKMRYLS